MIWSLYVPLRPSPKKGLENAVYFEEEAWNKIVDCAVENGILRARACYGRRMDETEGENGNKTPCEAGN